MTIANKVPLEKDHSLSISQEKGKWQGFHQLWIEERGAIFCLEKIQVNLELSKIFYSVMF